VALTLDTGPLLAAKVWTSFLDDVLAGSYRLDAPTLPDLKRCQQLQSDYRDLALGVVDASVIALAERLGETKVATLDHRHFGTVRTAHTSALQLLPVR
jgi:uncharacterized protein